MTTILHISADFPDPIVPAKTKAVERLVTAADGFRHIVYSLNRVNWRKDIALLPFDEDRIALVYGAPPYGFRLRSHLHPVAEMIAEDLRRRGIRPDLIHAHKFSVDGVIADRLSAITGAPFIASLWGDTDCKFFESKPGLRSHYREIARRARLLLPPAPWTADYFGVALRLDASRFELLPVMTAADELLPPQLCADPHFVTLFNWDAWWRKGFDTLLKALALLASDLPNVRLDVYGRGGPKALLEMTELIKRSGAGGGVRMLRPLDNGKVQQTVNAYAGFIMPSRRETFGMVYIEALLAGVPILWSKNEAIDGFFDPADVGYSCDPNSAEDVAAGMCRLIERQTQMKQRIAAMQAEGAFEPFRRDAIGARYRQILSVATSGKAQAADAA
jgi:glycosyltransferase involved in cell wall biosynthesis